MLVIADQPYTLTTELADEFVAVVRRVREEGTAGL
jgi:hypothetical protein